MADDFEATVRSVRVVPILLPRSVDFCLDVVGALAEGGARVIEIVLRTDAALPAIEAGRRAFPDLLFGAGTILSAAQYDEAVTAGAQFAISPGFAPELVQHARSGPIRLVPGVQTPSEVMAAQTAGSALLKFYPSEPAGGTAVLGDFGSVFPVVSFMPSGKINLALLPRYAALPNVASVGGSWMYLQDSEAMERRAIVERMAKSVETMRAQNPNAA